MKNKQRLTDAEIEKDIIHAIKNPPEESERSYKRWTIPCIVLALFLIVIEFIYPIFVVVFLLASFAFLLVYSICNRVSLQKQIENVSINDYQITTEIVHSTAEEHYRAEAGGTVGHRRTKKINNYTIRFESGKEWRVPKELYNWNERLRMHDIGIYNSTHRDDSMIVVSKKSSGKIVVAYKTEFFDYKA